MPDSVLFYPRSHRRRFNAPLTKAAESCFGVRQRQKTHYSACGAFDRDPFFESGSSARVAKVLCASNLSGGFVFVPSKHSHVAATRTGDFPCAVPVSLGRDRRDAQQKGLKLQRVCENGLVRHNEQHSFCLAALGQLNAGRVLRPYQPVFS